MHSSTRSTAIAEAILADAAPLPSPTRIGRALRAMRTRTASIEDYNIAQAFQARRDALAKSKRESLDKILSGIPGHYCSACAAGTCRSAVCGEERSIRGQR
jgi:hypothetical protein